MQNAGLLSSLKDLKDDMESTASNQNEAIDTRISPMTQRYILERLKRESTVERSILNLNERMIAVDKNLQLVIQNQITQDELLQNLLSTHSGISYLPFDDNKKGEKEKEDQQL